MQVCKADARGNDGPAHATIRIRSLVALLMARVQCSTLLRNCSSLRPAPLHNRHTLWPQRCPDSCIAAPARGSGRGAKRTAGATDAACRRAEGMHANGLAVTWDQAQQRPDRHTGRTAGGNTRDVTVERLGEVTVYRRGSTCCLYREGGRSDPEAARRRQPWPTPDRRRRASSAPVPRRWWPGTSVPSTTSSVRPGAPDIATARPSIGSRGSALRA